MMTHLDQSQTKLNGDLVEPRSETTVKKTFPEPRTRVPQNVKNLQEALQIFAMRTQVRKKDDVILDGARIGATYVNRRGEKQLLLFKREPYFMFGRHFPDVPEQGHGIPCNIKLVHWCYMNDATIMVLMGNGYCYSISGKKFWEYYEKYDTELPHAPGEIAAPFCFFDRIF